MKRGAGTWWTVLAVGLVAGSGLERWAQSAGPVARASSSPDQASELLPLLTDTNEGKLLFLVDGKQKIVSVYEYTQRKSKFKLVAVRQVAADHQLSEFNNEPPNVAEIERLIRQK